MIPLPQLAAEGFFSLRLLRLHCVCEGVGDGGAEEAACVVVDDVQGGGRMVQFDLAVHVEIEVEHEHALLRRLAGAVVDLAQQARAGFDVGLRATGMT